MYNISACKYFYKTANTINALMLMLAGWIAPGFEVEGFLSALIGSILLSLFALGVSRI